MDTKKSATAVIDKPKPSNTPPASNQPLEKPSPKEEARTHITEDLIHSSEKRVNDALDKFKASESVREEAHALKDDIAGRIRRISQTAKTEDAFRRDVDEFVSAAITYIINKARAENKKEKEKKEKEEYKKKEEEEKEARAKRIRNIEKEEKEKEDKKEAENQTAITQETTTVSMQSEEAASITEEQQKNAQSIQPPKEEQGTQQAAQQPEQTSGQLNEPQQNIASTPGMTPTTVNAHTPSPTVRNGSQAATVQSTSQLPTSVTAQKTINTAPISPVPSGSTMTKTATVTNAKSVNPSVKNTIPIPNKSIPSGIQVSTGKPAASTGKNKADVHMAIRHAIQQNATVINKSHTKTVKNTIPAAKVIQTVSNAGMTMTTVKKVPEKTYKNAFISEAKERPGTHTVQKTSIPGGNMSTIKKAVPLNNFHRVIQPTTGYMMAEEYPQVDEGNDRGSAVTGNPNMQQRTEYLGSSRNPGEENFSVRKYNNASTDADGEGGGGGGGNSREKRKRRGLPGMGKGESKLAQQAVKTAFQAAMRSPIFWGIVIALVIILLLILIIIGIGGEKAKEDKNTENPQLTLNKTGPTKAIKGENMEYTITANYPAAAEDLTIIDKIPVGVKYISSTPAGTYDAAGRTVTWNAKALNVALTNPVSMIVKVTLQAETDNITAVNIATGEVIPSDGSLLAVTKTGPPTATVGQNAEYTINATYQGAAEDITIVDKLPAGVKYVSSTPAGTYDAAAKTVTWNAKQLKLALANPLNLSVKVTLLVETNDIAFVNQATATVKASAGGQLSIPPSNNDCHGIYKSWMDQLKRVGKSNYGDPNCELVKQDPNGRWIIDKDKMLEGFKSVMPPKEAEGAFFCIVPTESNYNSNAWNPRSTSTARGSSGAYGNFQMNEAKYSNTGQPEDVGDVAWKQQAFNAYTWKNKYSGGKWRNYWPEMYIGCLNKYGL